MARWDDERRRGRPGEGWRDERREGPEREAQARWGEGEWPPPRLAHGGALRDDWRERVERYGGDPGWRELEQRDERGHWRGDDPRAPRGAEDDWRAGEKGWRDRERDEGFWRGGHGGPGSWRGGESGLRGEERLRAEERWRGEERVRPGTSYGMPPRREAGADEQEHPDAGRWERERGPARDDRWRGGGEPRPGAGGWRRTSQYSPAGEGPGSWGPDPDRHDRWADVDRDRGYERAALETSRSGFPGAGGQARGYEERAWASERGRTGRGPKNYRRSDDRIREDVCERIARSNVNADDVEVQVQNGEVTLTGFAETRWDKRSLEDLAADVFGVDEVHNQIRVKRPGDQARDANAAGDNPSEPLHH